MKLYTEEQVKGILAGVIRILDKTNKTSDESKYFANFYVSRLTPIELPSDEDIESGMNQRLFLSDKHAYFNSGAKAGFKLGAKWMKEQFENPKRATQ